MKKIIPRQRVTLLWNKQKDLIEKELQKIDFVKSEDEMIRDHGDYLDIVSSPEVLADCTYGMYIGRIDKKSSNIIRKVQEKKGICVTFSDYKKFAFNETSSNKKVLNEMINNYLERINSYYKVVDRYRTYKELDEFYSEHFKKKKYVEDDVTFYFNQFRNKLQRMIFAYYNNNPNYEDILKDTLAEVVNMQLEWLDEKKDVYKEDYIKSTSGILKVYYTDIILKYNIDVTKYDNVFINFITNPRRIGLLPFY